MTIPVFPLRTVLFPGVPMPLRIFEERYLRMLAEHAASDPAFVVALIESGCDVADNPGFHRVGTTARLSTLNALSDNLVDLVVVGGQRISLTGDDWDRGYARAAWTSEPDVGSDPEEAGRHASRALGAYIAFAQRIGRLVGRHFELSSIRTGDPASLSFDLATRLPLTTGEQQYILEDRDPVSRLRSVTRFIERERALMSQAGVIGVPLPFPGDGFSPN